jgi:L-ascorbate metabolism protein UlaG (beta-lactamase superfamily)
VSKALESVAIDPSFFDARADTLVTWLGMAGVLINARGTILLIDPLLSAVRRLPGVELAETGHRLKIHWPIRARQVPRADAVLYTHGDGDHFGHVTAQTLGWRCKPLFVAPPPVKAWLEEMDMGCTLVEAKDFDAIRIGAAQVQVTPALHDYATDIPFGRGDCCGYLVQTPDGAIWHPGDTRLIDELSRFRCDVMFFDVAAVDSHLGPAGSAALGRTSGAKVMLAYHYGTFDIPPGSWGGCLVEDALPLVKGHPAKLLAPRPGEIIRLPL